MVPPDREGREEDRVSRHQALLDDAALDRDYDDIRVRNGYAKNAR